MAYIQVCLPIKRCTFRRSILLGYSRRFNLQQNLFPASPAASHLFGFANASPNLCPQKNLSFATPLLAISTSMCQGGLQ